MYSVFTKFLNVCDIGENFSNTKETNNHSVT